MTDFQALMWCVRENKDDDTPRLILADWLEEYGDDPYWATFIRNGIELARIGTPHKILNGRTHLMKRGDGYWTVMGMEDSDQHFLKDGDRVSINLDQPKRAKHGLRVKRLKMDTELVLIRDDKSTPCRHKELSDKADSLWRSHKSGRWCFPFEGAFDWMSRGLMEKVACTFKDWDMFADKIESPVREVSISDVPPLESYVDRAELKFYFWFSGNKDRVAVISEKEVVNNRRPDRSLEGLINFVLEKMWPGITFHIRTNITFSGTLAVTGAFTFSGYLAQGFTS